MTGRFIVLSIAVSLLFTAGCSKNRGWLSRNDYSEMQDPFMEPDGAIAKSSNPASKAAGRASLDDTESTVAEGRARVPGPGMTTEEMAGPKPIRQVGTLNGMTESGRPVSSATYPEDVANRLSGRETTTAPRKDGVTSYSGPALSDFLQKQTAASRNSAAPMATETDQLSARTVSSPGAAAQGSLNPAATRAALPSISHEAESFSNFLSEKPGNIADSTQKANPLVQNADAEVNNFASWAEQQKRQWSNSVKAPESSVTQAPAKEQAGNVFDRARQASQEMADTNFATPEFDDVSADAAVPLIKRPGSTVAAPVLSKAKPPAANNFTAAENPFADSFTEFHSGGSASGAGASPVSSATSQSKSTARSLDDSFRMDTGWKPAQMTRP